MILFHHVFQCEADFECPRSLGPAHEECLCYFSALFNSIKCDFSRTSFEEIPRLGDTNRTVGRLEISGNFSLRLPTAPFAQVKVSASWTLIWRSVGINATLNSRIQALKLHRHKAGY